MAINKVGQPCKKCGTKVEQGFFKKDTNYFEDVLKCPKCKTNYFVKVKPKEPEKEIIQTGVRHQFLLSFFTGDHYDETEINGFWLVKQFNGKSKKWQVGIFPKESFNKYKKLDNNISEKTRQENHLRSIIN